MDDVIDQVPRVVDLIQLQNWKNGGVHAVDRDEAIALVEQLVRAAYSAGQVRATEDTSDRMLSVLNMLPV